jgi:hypothetical protein
MAFEGESLPRVDLADLNGSVKFSFVGGTYDIRFSWASMAKLQAIYNEAFLDQVETALGRKDINAICELLSFTTGKSKTEIMEASPPILPAVQALTMAWAVAWRGAAEQTPAEKESEEDQDTDGKKKTGPLTWWMRAVKLFFGQGES